ncbi:uncharacterized protein METZ01_LOCUS383573, partial [marine metagenome]
RPRKARHLNPHPVSFVRNYGTVAEGCLTVKNLWDRQIVETMIH